MLINALFLSVCFGILGSDIKKELIVLDFTHYLVSGTQSTRHKINNQELWLKGISPLIRDNL